MTPTRHSILKTATTLLLSAITCLANAQTAQTPQPSPQPQTAPKPLPAFYRNVILIDPAHGGPDTGAHLAGEVLEKDVTLSFSARLRTLLSAAGFTVLSTRDSDPADVLSTDQRAGLANHARPLACLILHATTSGSGVHIVTSALTPPDHLAAARIALPWQTAQAPTIPQSLRLANEIGLALTADKLPAVLLRASVPPLDNLTCAAVAIELAPPAHAGAQPTSVTDGSYQQITAKAIADGLSSYRNHNAPPPAAAATGPTGAAR